MTKDNTPLEDLIIMKPLEAPSGEPLPFSEKLRKYNMIKHIVESDHLKSSNNEATNSILYEMIKGILTEDVDAPQSYTEITETILNKIGRKT